MNIDQNVVRVIINTFIVVVVFGAWAMMFREGDGGMLSSSGITSLKFYTVLSNILEGIASFVWLLAAVGLGSTEAADHFKFVAVVCISLTLFTVMCFLGPINGYRYMFNGANFWFHLWIPLIAIIEFITLNHTKMGTLDSILSLVPMLLYCAGYIFNIVKHGIEGNDWYGFFAWGPIPGAAINVIMGLLMFGTSVLYRFLNVKITA